MSVWRWLVNKHARWPYQSNLKVLLRTLTNSCVGNTCISHIKCIWNMLTNILQSCNAYTYHNCSYIICLSSRSGVSGITILIFSSPSPGLFTPHSVLSSIRSLSILCIKCWLRVTQVCISYNWHSLLFLFITRSLHTSLRLVITPLTIYTLYKGLTSSHSGVPLIWCICITGSKISNYRSSSPHHSLNLPIHCDSKVIHGHI